MIKKSTATLAICLALFVAVATQAQPCAKSLAALKGVANLSVPPKTVRVRLAYVETNADLIDSPVPDANIIIQAGAARFDKRTNEDGVAVFDAVPCGGKIGITVHAESSGEDAVFHRRLACRRGTVDLGVLTTYFGGKPTLARRKTRYYGYDPIKGVWRDKNGRVVPNRVIRRILGT
jgi:hypothetical protein